MTNNKKIMVIPVWIVAASLMLAPKCGDDVEVGAFDGGTSADAAGDVARGLPAHCSNGIVDGDEENVDCGGSCDACSRDVCVVDGVKNGVEEGIDCGTMCRQQCTSHCENGMQDEDETGVDCGGASCGACVPAGDHCSNGLRDSDESGVDCGGSCGRVCVTYACDSQSQIPVTECQKLKDIYDAAGGTGWKSVTDWFSSSAPCAWQGIVCSGTPQKVSAISIVEDNLDGVVAGGLAVLTALQKFEMRAATMGGRVTELRGDVPWDLNAGLKILILSGNKLNRIPAGFGGLELLQVLNLEGNALAGTIPQEFETLVNLVDLNLRDNALQGTIPKVFGLFGQLRVLDLSSNSLSGALPPSLGDLSELENLQLYGNLFDGEIPKQFGQLKKLENLSLAINLLYGTVPTELGQLENLRALRLHMNELTGTIPIELGQLTKLEDLVLASNKFSGAIPHELGNLTNLVYLSLAHNGLQGKIPSTATNWTKLHDLDLCDQMGGLEADESVGMFLRSVTPKDHSDWPEHNSC